jgi:phage gp36-like protein
MRNYCLLTKSYNYLISGVGVRRSGIIKNHFSTIGVEMAYTTQTDLLNEFSVAELARLTGDATGSTIDSDKVALAADSAQAEIDTYLNNYYEVPFEEPPSIIDVISHELTVYNLYSYAYRNTEIPDQVKWRRINNLSILKSIQKGYLTFLGINKPKLIHTNKTNEDKIFVDNLIEYF